jgi:hypothetical protein
MSQNEIQVPRDYSTWKAMITQQCKETLDAGFLDARLEVLRNLKDPFTQRFVELYGESYVRSLIGWYERARSDLG